MLLDEVNSARLASFLAARVSWHVSSSREAALNRPTAVVVTSANPLITKSAWVCQILVLAYKAMP